MNVKQLDALSAYSQATKQMQEGLGSRDGNDGVQEGESAFSKLVSDSLGNVASSSNNLEVQSAKALTGQADLVDVATAVQNAEVVVQTVVSVRDKVVSAYNDILKMPI